MQNVSVGSNVELDEPDIYHFKAKGRAMSARKKSTRRNTGGRRTVTPPPYNAGPDIASIERGIAATDLAMNIASRYVRSGWI